MAADLSALAPYANDDDVVRFLQAMQANSAAPSIDSLPIDATYTSQIGDADTDYANTIAGINAQVPGIQRAYGYDASGSVDPNNPFGRAQLLQRAYQQQQTGNTNNYAARGQLYSGALQRAQNDAQFNYQANDAALRGEYGQQLAGLSAQRTQAQNVRNQAARDASWQRVNALIQARAAGFGSSPTGGAPAIPEPGYAPVGPDGTYLDPEAAAMAPQVGGAAGPVSGGPDYSGYNYKQGAGWQQAQQILANLYKPKPYQGPTAQGTGGVAAPGRRR